MLSFTLLSPFPTVSLGYQSLRWVILGACLFSTLSTASPLSLSDDPVLVEQRNLYQEVYKKFRQRKIPYDQIPWGALEGYPLTPYLEYLHLIRHLGSTPKATNDAFLQTYENSWLAHRLRNNLLNRYAIRKEWDNFLSYYDPTTNDDTLRCQASYAAYKTGDTSALKKVAEIWVSKKSLPKACDQLFSIWLKSDYFSPNYAWVRHLKVVNARNLSLAAYLHRYISPELQPLASQLRSLSSQPHRLKRLLNLSRNNRSPAYLSALEDVVHYGTRRWARKDINAALANWERFDGQWLLQQEDRQKTQEYLAKRLLRKGKVDHAVQLLAQHGSVSAPILEDLIRASLKLGQWPSVMSLIAKLPSEERNSPRWRYWQARALVADNNNLDNQRRRNKVFEELAQKRDFYGFLAADWLGMEYHLEHADASPAERSITQLANQPAFARSREWFALGNLHKARMEWRYGSKQLDHQGLLSAAKLANGWGWHRKAIESLGQARFWDDLNLRFPLIYQEEVKLASQKTDLAPQYVLAIARQESAFASDARSPAGAMGLMQLMPATAKDTARRMGIRYNRKDLYNPAQNINIGSNYLRQVMSRFDGNRVLATAAYNAGPHRVSRWLSPEGQELDVDVWIETIPYKETRGYVQNVLSYSLIYSHLMGDKVRFLRPKELKQKL